MPSLRRATGIPAVADSIEYGTLTHTEYRFDNTETEILNAPEDTDWTRWGMLSDRKYMRLYFFKQGSNNKLYQFILGPDGFYYDPSYGYLTITGAYHKTDDILDEFPEDADPSHIGMLSTPNFETYKVDGSRIGTNQDAERDLPVPNNYHVYMIDKPEVQAARDTEDRRLYQFIWRKDSDESTGKGIDTKTMEHNGITNNRFDIEAFPAEVNVDWSRWTMNYDSNRYQLMLKAYVMTIFKQGSNTELYQARFDYLPGTNNEKSAYQYSGTAELFGAPEGIDYNKFATVFDGIKTSVFFLKM